MGTVSVLMYGSPMDVEAALKLKAEAAKADYYVIIMIDDTMVQASGIRRQFCTVNSGQPLSQLYTVLHPFTFSCA